MKHLFPILIILSLFALILAQPVQAKDTALGISAKLARSEATAVSDKRAQVLEKFLRSYNSPLAASADTFVAEADKNTIDWRLVAAIAGVESTFAKHLPDNSYNAWGWGIYGDNMIRFASYDEAIATISKSLRVDYMNKWKAKNVYEIGKFYAASPTWAERVTFFMNKIDAAVAAQNESIADLSISI